MGDAELIRSALPPEAHLWFALVITLATVGPYIIRGRPKR